MTGQRIIPAKPAASSLVIATLRRTVLTEDERRTAKIIATCTAGGLLDAEIAMIGRPPMLLGQLLECERTLTGGAASEESRNAAAELLIWSSHRPHRLLAATHLLARAGSA